jgi:hypothetical protein
MSVDGKDLVRVEATERVDEPDFTALSRQVLRYHESVVGSLIAQRAVVSAGWALVTLSPTDIRVERQDGIFVGPESGTTDGITNVGVTSSSAVFDYGGTDQVVTFSGLPVGSYHVYVYQRFTKADPQVRIKFDVTTQTEFKDTFEVRYRAAWFAEILPIATVPADDRVRIATVDWDGSDLATSTISRTLPLLYEGQAVTGGSAVPHTPSGFTGTSPLVDFSRSTDRISNGSKTFAEFANAALKCIEEIKSQHIPEWYAIPSRGKALDSVLPVTYTIGEGTPHCVGMFNGLSTPVNIGGQDYYDVSNALDTAVTAALVDSPSAAVILLKPGHYYLNQDISLPKEFGIRHWSIVGSGSGATTLYVDTAGLFEVGHDGVATDTASIEFGRMTVVHATGGTLLNHEGSDTTNSDEYTFRDLQYFGDPSNFVVTPKVGAPNPGDNSVWLFDRCDLDAGRVQVTASQLTVLGGRMASLEMSSGPGTLSREVNIQNAVLVALDSQNDAYDIRVEGCDVGNIDAVDSAGTLVRVEGCRFPAELAQSGSSERINILDCEMLHVSGCTFEQTDAAPATFIRTESNGVVVEDCHFFRAGATTFPGTWAVQCIGTDKDRSQIRGCYLNSAVENGFQGADVIDCTVEINQSGLTGTVFGHDTTGFPSRKFRILGTTVKQSAGLATHLARDFLQIKDCLFTIPNSIPGEFEILQETGFTVEIDIESTKFDVGTLGQVILEEGLGTFPNWSVRLNEVEVTDSLTIENNNPNPSGLWLLDDVTLGSGVLSCLTNGVPSQTLNVTLSRCSAPKIEVLASMANLSIDGCAVGYVASPDNGLQIEQRSTSPSESGIAYVRDCIFGETDPRYRSSNVPGIWGTSSGAISGNSAISLTNISTGRFRSVYVSGCAVSSLMAGYGAIVIESSGEASVTDCDIYVTYTSGQSTQAVMDITADRIQVSNNQIVCEGSGGVFDAPRALHGRQGFGFSVAAVVMASNTIHHVSTRIPTGLGLVEYTPAGGIVSAQFLMNGNSLTIAAQDAASQLWVDAIAAGVCRHVASSNSLYDSNGFLTVAAGALPNMSAGFGAATSVNANNAG